MRKERDLNQSYDKNPYTTGKFQKFHIPRSWADSVQMKIKHASQVIDA